jgi:hypothetical protein
VHDGVGAPGRQQVDELLEVVGDVELLEADVAAGELAPDGAADVEGLDRRQGLGAELAVGAAAREVVDDEDVVPACGEVQRCGPATEAIAAQDQDAQDKLRFSSVMGPSMIARVGTQTTESTVDPYMPGS